MGLFDKLFETKYCSTCNSPLSFLGYKKYQNGVCCNDCISMFSPFFKERKNIRIEEIKYQLDCRRMNAEKLKQFQVTRTLGLATKVLIDEEQEQFIITSSKNFRSDNADVIECSAITNCSVDITENRKEIKYVDSNGDTKSFSPPSYAYSYDFFIDIQVSIPYINDIRFKVNSKPIDNDQQLLIKMSGGILANIADMVLPARSNNGVTSNAAEVQASLEYKKCEQIANQIQSALNSYHHVKTHRSVHNPETKTCPWCGSKNLSSSQRLCECCGGLLDD